MEAFGDVKNMVGKTGPLNINTGVYERELGEYEEVGLYAIDDLMVIGNEGKKITFDYVMEIFEYMKDQFKQIDDNGFAYAYFYEGIKYNKKDNIYEVLWGS